MKAAIWHLDVEEVKLCRGKRYLIPLCKAVDVLQEAPLVILVDVQSGKSHERGHDALKMAARPL